MHRTINFTSTERVIALFTTTTATAANLKPSWRLNSPLRPLAFVHSSSRRVMDSLSSAATNGIDDFVHIEDGERVSGEDHETSPKNVVVNNEIPNSYERKVLPAELSRSAVMLTCESAAANGVCDVYLVGTAHVSAESCREVEAVIDFLKPEVVFLELCAGRVAVLTPQNLKVASKLEVFPGAEFRVAYEEAMKYGGKVILGDRPVHITLRRTWAKMPLWHKTKLLYSLMFQAVFLPDPEVLSKALKEMDDVDMLTLVIQEMSKQFPTLMETLVRERDQYMSAKLLKIASEHNSVVAVVGKGHLPGIKNNWKQPVDMKEILSIPTRKNTITLLELPSYPAFISPSENSRAIFHRKEYNEAIMADKEIYYTTAMKITILTKGSGFSMDVDPREPILQIKRKIHDFLGIPIDSQTLTIFDLELIDGLDLSDYPPISDGTVVHLTTTTTNNPHSPTLAISTKIRITITFPSRKVEIEVDRATDTLHTLKEKIHIVDGTPIKRMALFFNGTEMEDDGSTSRCLSDYGIRDGSEVVAHTRSVRVAASAAARRVAVVVQAAASLMGAARMSVEMNEWCRVEEMRRAMVEKGMLPEDEYIFIHKQRIMNGERSLRWHGVESGDFVYVFKGSVSRVGDEGF
ncbi:TraB family protein [Striga asiatica]|uniref:TraB family protein n=1 Tax=Striga asiatica TaxID=4170 RepID=A0A5A7QTK7_STRAF|nr:TraB family protein [Striga asiatica]